MENLGIDPKLMLAQIVNFVIFFFIIKRFIAKPFAQFIEKERKIEKEKAELLETIRKSEASCEVKEKEIKETARKTITGAMEEAKRESATLKKSLTDQATKEAQGILDSARKQIAEERTDLHQQVKDQTLKLSVSILEQALQDSLDEESRRKVTQNILKKMPHQISVKL